MRKALCSVVVLAVAVVLGAGLLAAEGKKHDVNATVVSVDVAGKTLTIKGDDGKDKTVPVSGEAVK